MKEMVKKTVKHILDSYLEQNNRRKTPERYAVLDTIYSMEGCFTMDELSNKMAEDKRFKISRATLYNTINLLLKLRLVVAHHIMRQTQYEACYSRDGQCRQICTMCGKVTEVQSASLNNAIKEMRCHRFKKDVYSLYIYGICSRCQSKMTREATRNEDKKKQNRPKQ